MNKIQKQEMIDTLTQELIKAFDQSQINPITKESLIDIVNGYLVGLVECNSKHLKFEAHDNGNGSIEVIACNMYSLLSMNGLRVLPEVVEGLEEYETEFGTFIHKQIITSDSIVYENLFKPLSVKFIHFEGVLLDVGETKSSELPNSLPSDSDG